VCLVGDCSEVKIVSKPQEGGAGGAGFMLSRSLLSVTAQRAVRDDGDLPCA
jgi:hypothetical protein